MGRWACVLGALASLSVTADAVFYNYTTAILNTAAFGFPAIVMCNNTFGQGNCSGVYTIIPGMADGSSSNQGNGKAFADPIQWAFVGATNTVSGLTGYGIQSSLMFSPGKQNYLDDTSIGYDVCGIALDPIVILPNTYLRGQSDNGSGLAMLDLPCKAAIQDQVNTAAKAVLAEGGVQIAQTCAAISSKLGSTPPRQCWPFLKASDPSLNWINQYFTLTQSPKTGASNLAAACTATDDSGDTFYNIDTLLSSSYNLGVYQILTTVPWPIITVYLPVVSGAKSVISEPYTDVTVVHINHVNDGSVARVTLAAPGPVDYSLEYANSTTNSTTNSTASATPSAVASSGISGGAIAGIVIGVIAILAVIAIAALLLMRKRRRRRDAAGVMELDGNGEKRHLSEAHGEAVYEMSPDDRTTTELPSPSAPRHEMPSYTQKFEMDGGRPPVELPASMPDHKENHRYG